MTPIPTSKDGIDLWIFAYASLMWKPDFSYIEAKKARVHGYSRQLCIYSDVYRGKPGCPGLVFGLDRGGSCLGHAMRVGSKNVDDVVAYLFKRELIDNVYHPRMVATEFDSSKAKSLAFIVDRSHHKYAGMLPKNKAVKYILQGQGQSGTCFEYIRNTVEHLQELGIRDRQLEELLAMAQEETCG